VKITSLALIILALLSGHSIAAEEDTRYKLEFKQKLAFFMEVGVQAGGDGSEPLPIYDRASGLYFTGIPLTLVGNWNGVSSDLDQFWEDEAEAGGLYKFVAGVEIPLVKQLTLLASIGYQFDEVYGDLTDGSGGQGSFQYNRNTIEIIPFYNMGRHRIGIGGEFHLSPKAIHKEYSSSFVLKSTYNFEDTIGGILRYDYLVNKHTSVGLKYTKISYDFERVRTLYDISGVVIDDISADCLSNCEEVVNADSVGIHLTYRF
jgi:hypothetical protein